MIRNRVLCVCVAAICIWSAALAEGLSNLPVWTDEANQANASFGASVANAGDVNGDGYDDVIVGARGYSNGESAEGAAFLYLGGPSGLSTTAAWTAEPNVADANFGTSVSSAGDVNGDGYADVIIGANWYADGQVYEGRAYVYHGGPSGLSASPDWAVESNMVHAFFGDEVASAGDVNGDGYDDVIVSAPMYGLNGAVFVYFGSATGLSTTADWAMAGDQNFGVFGSGAQGAGDVNGDGYDDIVIGAQFQGQGGQVFVYHGSAFGPSLSPDWVANGMQVDGFFGFSVAGVGDVNGDGFDDVLIGAPQEDGGEQDEGRVHLVLGSVAGLETSIVWSAEPNQANSQFGASISGAGDVNGDGYADAIVGALSYEDEATGTGKAYLYTGNPAGLSADPVWTAQSDQSNAFFGITVSAAGDVNGDGVSDAIVGADWYDNGETNEGRAFVYHGISSAPIAYDDAVVTDEDRPVSTILSASDPNGDPLTWNVGTPGHGTLTGTAPNLVYTPDPDYNGPDSFTFTVNDGTSDSNVATVSITVNPVNDPPVTEMLFLVTDEDTPLSFTLPAVDVDGDPLTWTVFPPFHGTLTGTAPDLTYTPDPDYFGLDYFIFYVNDGTVNSNISPVVIIVNPVNDTPVAHDDSVTTDEDTAVDIMLSANDVEFDPLTWTVNPPSHGTLTGTAPNLVYTPDPDYNGPDSFTFTVNDGSSNSNVATVSITVNPVNDAPVANDMVLITDEDAPLSFVLDAYDVDGDFLFYNYLPPANGTLTGTAPNLTYTPDPDFSGTDSFVFNAIDGQINSGIAFVTIIVNPVNDVPVAYDQTVVTDEDTPVGVTLDADDPDPQPLTWNVNPPNHGTLTGTAPNLIYTPNSNYSGPDSFTFSVNDGLVDSNLATVSITVNPVNQPPLPGSSASATPNPILVTETTDLHVSASDPDGDTLLYTWSVLTGPGTATFSTNDTPTSNDSVASFSTPGDYTLEVVIDDGNGGVITDQCSVTVLPVVIEPVSALIDIDPQNQFDAFQFRATNQSPTVFLNSIQFTVVGGGAFDSFEEGSDFTVSPDTGGGNEGNTAVTVTVDFPAGLPPAASAQNSGFDFLSDIDGILDGIDVVATFSNGVTLSGPMVNIGDSDDGDPDLWRFLGSSGGNPPVAEDAVYWTSVGTPITFVLEASDADGDPLSWDVASPGHGTLTGTAPNLTYIPDPGYNGPDAFTFTVDDGTFTSNVATIRIMVGLGGDILYVTNGSANSDDLAVIDRLINTLGFTSVTVVDDSAAQTSDADGKVLVLITSRVNSGQVNTKFRDVDVPVMHWEQALNDDLEISDRGRTINANSVVITPRGETHPASAYLPQGEHVVHTSSESMHSQSNNGLAPGALVLAASDIGDPLLTIIDTGAVMRDGNPAPARRVAAFYGDDGLTGYNATGEAIFDAAVIWAVFGGAPPPNNQPVADSCTVTTHRNMPATFTLSATDANGDPLTWYIGTTTHGTLSGTAPNLTYTPAPGYIGPDSFTFHVNDGTSDSNTATVDIFVTVGGDVLYVTNGSASAEDQVVINRLENELGFDSVTVVDDSDSETGDADGKALVVITSRVGSGRVNSRFRDVAVPVIHWEQALNDDMEISNRGFGQTGNELTITAAGATHPVGAELSQGLHLLSSGNMGMHTQNNAGLAPGAVVVATFESTDIPLITAIDTGDLLRNGVPAPARRVATFYGDDALTGYNQTAVALFDAAVLWAVADVQELEITNISVSTGEPYVVDDSLDVGDDLYIDRGYDYGDIGSYAGLKHIQTANDDKRVSTETHLSFDVNRPVTVYVLYDVRGTSLPDWMSGWTDTGGTIIVRGDADHHVYSKSFPAGTIVLGGNRAPGAAGANSNYTVLVE